MVISVEAEAKNNWLAQSWSFVWNTDAKTQTWRHQALTENQLWGIPG